MALASECILGVLGCDVKGYRRYGRKWVHRMAWEDANQATIPPGYVIMHLCDTPRCINPKHLQLGTQKENMLDAWNKGRIGGGPAENAKKTHCPAGHILEGENIYFHPTGRRECKLCKRAYNNKRYHTKVKNHVTTR